MTTVLGIDPALRHTGVGRWRDGRLSTMTIATERDHYRTYEDRVRFIMSHIWPLVTDPQTFVVLEAPFVGRNNRTAMELAGMHHILRYGLHVRKVPWAMVTPASLKRFATGGGGASKEDMVHRASMDYGPTAELTMGKWVPPHETVDSNSHEADALHCLTLGLMHAPVYTGAPPTNYEQRIEYEAISKDWPALEWEIP